MKFKPLLKKIIILQVPVVLVALVGFALRSESDFFVVKEVPIEVEFKTHQTALVESFKPSIEKALLSLQGQNIWKVSLAQVQRKLLANPWIEQVALRRRFPDRITALIRINSIAFLYLDKKNRIHPVTTTGVNLGRVKATLAPMAPILRNSAIVKDQALLDKVIGLLEQVPNVGELRRENIASIDFKPVTGLTLQLIAGGETVYLGEAKVQTKGLQVLRVLDYLKSQKQKARVIDASFSKKVLVRPRKRS